MAVNYVKFNVINSADKFSNEQQIFCLRLGLFGVDCKCKIILPACPGLAFLYIFLLRQKTRKLNFIHWHRLPYYNRLPTRLPYYNSCMTASASLMARSIGLPPSCRLDLEMPVICMLPTFPRATTSLSLPFCSLLTLSRQCIHACAA